MRGCWRLGRVVAIGALVLGGFAACTDTEESPGSGTTGGTPPADGGGGITPDLGGGLTPDPGPAATDPGPAIDTGPSEHTDTEPGLELPPDFNKPCENNSQCTTGFCIEGPDGKICTMTCIEDCPNGFECEGVTNFGGDVTYICNPKFVALCTACEKDSDCGGTGHCIEVDLEGTHCARECNLAEPCPTGYLCKAIDDLTNLCTPVTGSCICTHDLLGTNQTCYHENSFGICKGSVTCGGPGGWSECDANEPSLETCDGKDNDCDNEVDEGVAGAPCQEQNDFGTCLGVTECHGSAGLACTAQMPVAESCDGMDNDCNGKVDDANADGCIELFEDVDKDGIGNANSTACLCKAEGNFTAGVGGDCNDFNPSIGTGKPEICNGLDDDCDGEVDTEGSIGCTFLFKDADGDGYGVATDAKCLCGSSGNYKSPIAGDCDDENPDAFPANQEKCNGFDDNCNGVEDEAGAIWCTPYLKDSDGDGFGVTSLTMCLCAPNDIFKSLSPGDCDDEEPATHPGGLEICDGIDNSCNGIVDEECDGDNDGYCNALKPIVGTPFSCPLGGGDCVDWAPEIHPNADEHCDGLDNDCDTQIDEGVQAPCGGCENVCLMGAGPDSEAPFEEDGALFDGAGFDPEGNIVLDSSSIKLNMIWVSNSGEGTISKINTTTGKEVARYNLCNDPSRTAVDSLGNAWIACRGDGVVAKVALSVDECVDLSGDGEIQTSMDENGDGVISGGEMLAPGVDECVLFAVAPDGADGKARAMGVDKDDHGWVGMWNTNRLWKLHRDTGAVMQQIDIPTKPYGLGLDQNGIIWISGRGTNQLVRVDPNLSGGIQAFKPPQSCFEPYGMTIDENGRIWMANCCCEHVAWRFDPKTSAWAKAGVTARPRGIAADGNGFIYVANDESSHVHKIDANTMAVVGKTDLGAGHFPIGMAVDFDGMVWAINHTTSTGTRIDPSDMSILFETPTGPKPYTYSDMTGFQQKTIVAPKGTYTHVFKGWDEGTTQWMQVGLELTTPQGTSAQLRVRTAGDPVALEEAVWTPFFGPFPPKLPTVNLSQFGSVLGRFLEVEVQLFSEDSKSTPILKSIDIVAAPF